MVSAGPATRLPNRISSSSTRQIPSFPGSQGSQQKTEDCRSHPTPFSDSSNRTSPFRGKTLRSLLHLLYGAKTQRGLESHPRPQICQQVCGLQEIQNGNSPLNRPLPAPKGILNLLRLIRSIPTYPNSVPTPSFPAVCSGGTTSTVPRPAIWPGIGAQSIHQDDGQHHCVSEVTRNICTCVSRRRPSSSGNKGSCYQDYQSSLQHLQTSRFPYQFQEKLSPSHANPHTPRHGDQHTPNEGHSSQQQGSEDHTPNKPSDIQQPLLSPGVGKSSRSHGSGNRSAPMGPFAFQTSTTASSSLSTGYSQQAKPLPEDSPQSQTFPSVVDDTRQPQKGKTVRRPRENRGFYRRKSLWLGSHNTDSGSTRNLVGEGTEPVNQCIGVKSHQTRHEDLSQNSSRISRLDTHRQRSSKSPHQLPRRVQVSSAASGIPQDSAVGRTAPSIPNSRIHKRQSQHEGGLAEQDYYPSRGMESLQSGLRSHYYDLGIPSSGPLRHKRKCPSSEIYDQVLPQKCRKRRRTHEYLAPRPPLCISTDSTDSVSAQTDQAQQIPSNSGGSILAQETVVPGHSGTYNSRTASSPPERGLADPRPYRTSKPTEASLDRVALERRSLRDLGLSDTVASTILASRKPSTTRIYNATWRIYLVWCRTHNVSPTTPSLSQVLQFLQDGRDRRKLKASTLRRQIAALATILPNLDGHCVSAHPLIKRFIKGSLLLDPPIRHRFPTWNLSTVLNGLTRPPFEPMTEVHIKWVRLKTIFLVAITSARRVSELAALSSKPSLCVFHKDKVTLRLDPSFLPKCVSNFHLGQDIFLPTLCPNPSNLEEKRWHTLDVRRALKIFLARTQSLRRSDRLFINISPPNVGLPMSAASLSKAVREAIAEAYKTLKETVPSGITAHSLRSAATSAALLHNVPIVDICRAATWASTTTFTRHYRLDAASAGDAVFGSQVLRHAFHSRGSSAPPVVGL